MTALRLVNCTTRERTIAGAAFIIRHEILRNGAEVAFFKLVAQLCSLVFLRTRHTIRALKRQVDLAIILRRHNYSLSDVRTLTVLLLILGDDAFLVLTLLLNRVTLVRFLPRINLTRNLIIEVGSNNLYTTSGAITLARLVLVVPRQRSSILTRLPPHLRLVRSSKALNGAIVAIVRELTINRRLTGLTIKCTRPLGLRLR